MNETTAGQSPTKKRDRASKLARRQSLKFKRSKVSAQKKLESASEKRAKRERNANNNKRNAMNLERAGKKKARESVMDMIKGAKREGGTEGVKGLFKSMFKSKKK